MTRKLAQGVGALLLFGATASGCHHAALPRPASERVTSPLRTAPLPMEVLPLSNAARVAPKADVIEPVESYPFTLSLPAKLACKLEEASSRVPSVELGLSSEGPAFGTMRSRSFVARIGVGERDIVVDADGPGLKLRAIAIARTFSLYAGSPVLFQDFVMPQPYAQLRIVSGEVGGVEASIETPKQLDLASRKPLTAHVPCETLALRQAGFDPVAALRLLSAAPGGSAATKAYLPPTATIATTPGGPSAATLRLGGASGGASPEVSVLARAGRYAQITWEVGDVVVFGWVDGAKLRSHDWQGDAFGAGGLGLSGIGEGGRRTLSCEREVPLRAQVGSRTEIVGVILPRTAIAIEGERPYAFEVDLPSTGLDKHEKAVLLVEKEHVSDCSG